MKIDFKIKLNKKIQANKIIQICIFIYDKVHLDSWVTLRFRLYWVCIVSFV